MSISGFFEFFEFFLIIYMCHFTVVPRVKMINLVPRSVFNFNLVSIFVKMKQYCLSLNWYSIYSFYKSYGDILTKINVFIKYF